MEFFKKHKSLKKRLETLEDYLGLFFTVDSDGYAEYKTDGDDKWALIPRINREIKELQDAKDKKASK